MSTNQEVNELTPVPEFVILRFGYHNLRNTLSLFDEDGWSIAENPREINRSSQRAGYEGVLKHEATGRYFIVFWNHRFFQDEVEVDFDSPTSEVFPVEVKVTKFMYRSEMILHKLMEASR